MTRKIIAIFAALLLSVSLVACNNEEKTEETTTGTKIEVPTTEGETTAESTEDETEVKTENNTPNTEIGDPGEYSYSDCNEDVYVNNPGSEVTLRSAEYEALGTVKHGDKLKRIGLSTDNANYWSKVTLGEKTYYIASKFLTTMKDPNEGFADVTKTVYINAMTGSLKIRNIPSMDSTVIGYAVENEAIKVIAENTITGWYKIEFVNADNVTTTGFIASNAEYFVQDEETTVETTEAVTETEAESVTETETAAPAGK